MTYYVLAVDGKVYGPVDIDGLRQWFREGRLVESTRLREAETGRDLAAADLPDLRALFGGASPHAGFDSRPHPPRCAHCGGAMAFGDTRCYQCGTVLGFGPQPRLFVTGGEIGDRILGFALGFGSWWLWGIGALGGLLLYFVIRGGYPMFARGIGFGLATMGVFVLGAVVVCFVNFSSMWH